MLYEFSGKFSRKGHGRKFFPFEIENFFGPFLGFAAESFYEFFKESFEKEIIQSFYFKSLNYEFLLIFSLKVLLNFQKLLNYKLFFNIFEAFKKTELFRHFYYLSI